MSDNLSPPTLNLLSNELEEVECDELAVVLNVSDIEDIREQYPGTGQWKIDCLQKWLDQRDTVHSWCTVANAVDKINPVVAEHIRNKYSTILDDVPSKPQHEEHRIVNDDQRLNINSAIEEQQASLSKVPLQIDIVKEITHFKHRFVKLVSKTRESLVDRPNKLLPFYRYLKQQKLCDQMSIPNESDITYDTLFDKLQTKWHYLKYQLLQKIVEMFLFDTDLPDEVQNYQSDLTTFKTSTKMKDLVIIKSKGNTSEKVKVELKVQGMWLEVTIQQFEFLAKLLFQDYEDLLTDMIVKRCSTSMSITCSVSKETADLIAQLKYNHEELLLLGVISLTVEYNTLFSYNSTQDDMTFDAAL